MYATVRKPVQKQLAKLNPVHQRKLNVAIVEPSLCLAADMSGSPLKFVLMCDAGELKHTFTVLEPLVSAISIEQG
jgi:hypothetical protein